MKRIAFYFQTVVSSRKFKRAFLFFGCAVLFVFLFLFLFRNSILTHFTQNITKQLSKKYNVQFIVKNSEFIGLKTAEFREIYIVDSTKNDTLFSTQKIIAEISLLNLLRTHLRFSSVQIEKLNMNLIDKKEYNNFSFFFKNTKDVQKNKKPKQTINYADASEKLLKLIFDVIPHEFNANQIAFSLITDSVDYTFKSDNIRIYNGQFFSTFTTSENDSISSWKTLGSIDFASNTGEIKLIRENSSSFFPLYSKYKLKVAVDTLTLSLNSMKKDGDRLMLSGKANLNNFFVNHWRISPKNVTVLNSSMEFNFTIGDSYFQVDSSTVAKLNKITVIPYVKVQLSPYKEMILNVVIPKVSSNNFFESLPHGLFENLEGIETLGEIDYKLMFSMNTNFPDSVQFSSTLSPHHFKIKKYGRTNFSKINDEFLYTAFDGDRAIRTFPVGSSNPSYTPLDQISNFLQQSIQNSEDGNFYGHKGFNERRFRESIAENYKKKRFARGASTISMQLVKNLFLRKNKTIARKVEEALLVWLIEQNRLISKKRMFEVYLNIIEFGHNVYGIGEASQFYFNKTPIQLNLEESIFLSMIVPRPKWYMYHFDETGNLKENTQSYFNLIGGLLVKHKAITEEQFGSLTNKIELSGKAKEFLIKKDTTINAEKLMIEDEKE